MVTSLRLFLEVTTVHAWHTDIWANAAQLQDTHPPFTPLSPYTQMDCLTASNNQSLMCTPQDLPCRSLFVCRACTLATSSRLMKAVANAYAWHTQQSPKAAQLLNHPPPHPLLKQPNTLLNSIHPRKVTHAPPTIPDLACLC